MASNRHLDWMRDVIGLSPAFVHVDRRSRIALKLRAVPNGNETTNDQGTPVSRLNEPINKNPCSVIATAF